MQYIIACWRRDFLKAVWRGMCRVNLRLGLDPADAAPRPGERRLMVGGKVVTIRHPIGVHGDR